jgi:hypothetical protein
VKLGPPFHLPSLVYQGMNINPTNESAQLRQVEKATSNDIPSGIYHHEMITRHSEGVIFCVCNSMVATSVVYKQQPQVGICN